MPVVNIMMLEGRSKDQKCQLIETITQEICDICHCPKESVTVIIEDIPKENWGTAGKSKT
jgi:4-oxalocrotonate tautomerase